MDPATLRDPRLLAQLAERLDGSNDADTLLAREVARYYGLLARELAAVQLTREEAAVLQVAVRGTERARIAGSPFGSLAEAVAAEIRRTQDLPAQRVVDGEKLVAGVATWSPARTVAVLDACERVRAAAHRGGSTTLAELLRAVGPPRDEAAPPRR